MGRAGEARPQVGRKTDAIHGGEAQAAVWESEREPALLPSLLITPGRYQMRLTAMLRPTVARSLVWSSATSVPCLFAAVVCVLQGPYWGGAVEDLAPGPL